MRKHSKSKTLTAIDLVQLSYYVEEIHTLRKSLKKLKHEHFNLLRSLKHQIVSDASFESFGKPGFHEEEKERNLLVEEILSSFPDLDAVKECGTDQEVFNYALYNCKMSTTPYNNNDPSYQRNINISVLSHRQETNKELKLIEPQGDLFITKQRRQSSVSLDLSQAYKPISIYSQLFIRYDFAQVYFKVAKSNEYAYLIKSDLKAMANMAAVLGMAHQEMKTYCWLGSRAFFSVETLYMKNEAESQKRILILQGSFLYFLDPDSLALISSIPIALIEGVYLIKHSNLLLLTIKSNHSYLLQITPSIEFLLFLFHHFPRMKLPMVKMKECELNLLDWQNYEQIGILSQTNKENKQIHFSDQFVKLFALKALKSANVLIRFCDSKIQKKREDAVLVLTNVGLNIFRRFSDTQSQFYPIFNAKVSIPSYSLHKAETNDYRAIMAIQIPGKSRIQVSFCKKEEIESWMKEIKTLQIEYEEEENRALGLI